MRSLIFILLLYWNLNAQKDYELKGKVYLVNSNHTALEGVQIIANHAIATQSDLQGVYTLSFNNGLVIDNYRIKFSTIYKEGYDLVESTDMNAIYYNPVARTPLNIYMCPKGMVNEAKITLFNISTTNFLARIKRLEKEVVENKGDKAKILDELSKLKSNQDNYLSYAKYLADGLAKLNLDEISAELKEGYFLFLAGKFDEAIAKIDNDSLNRKLAKAEAVTNIANTQITDIVLKKNFLAKLYFAKNKIDSAEYYFDDCLSISIEHGLVSEVLLKDYINYFSLSKKYVKCAEAIKKTIPNCTNLYEKSIKYLQVAEYYSLGIYNLYAEREQGNTWTDSARIFEYVYPCLRYCDTARNLFQQDIFNRDSASAFFLGKALYIQSLVVFANENALKEHQEGISFILNDAIIYYQTAVRKDSASPNKYYVGIGDVASLFVKQSLRNLNKNKYTGTDSTKANRQIKSFFSVAVKYYHNYLKTCSETNGNTKFDTLNILDKLHDIRLNYISYLKQSKKDIFIEECLIDDIADNYIYLRSEYSKSINFYETSIFFLKVYAFYKEWNKFDSTLQSVNIINDSIPPYNFNVKSISNVKRRLEIAENLELNSDNYRRIDKLIQPIRYYTRAFDEVKENSYIRYLYLEFVVSLNEYKTKPSLESKTNLKSIGEYYLKTHGKLPDRSVHIDKMNYVKKILQSL